jgi:hypothetical protein
MNTNTEEEAQACVDRLRDWVKYTKDRSDSLRRLSEDNLNESEKERLKAKAGCFYSLAVEVFQLLPPVTGEDHDPAQMSLIGEEESK